MWQSVRLRVFDARLGDIDLEVVSAQGVGVEHADRLVRLGLVGHGDKREALRETGALVHDEFDRRDGPCGCEERHDLVLFGGLVEVAYVNANIHLMTAFSSTAGMKMTAAPVKRVGGQGTTDGSNLLHFQCNTHSVRRRGSLQVVAQGGCHSNKLHLSI